MLRKSIGLMDLGTISLDMLQELFMDTLAGDRSILGRVFGNIWGLQPLKPVTKAQAAVALTSGRTSDSLQTVISRIESEILSHSIESQEIKYDLLHKGDIPRFWEQKMNQEKEHGLGLQQEYVMVSRKFDEEKIAYEKDKYDHIKVKAALDCQWQHLTSLKDEVDGMSERVENEKYVVAAEARNVWNCALIYVRCKMPCLKPSRYWKLRKKHLKFSGLGWRMGHAKANSVRKFSKMPCKGGNVMDNASIGR